MTAHESVGWWEGSWNQTRSGQLVSVSHSIRCGKTCSLLIYTAPLPPLLSGNRQRCFSGSSSSVLGGGGNPHVKRFGLLRRARSHLEHLVFGSLPKMGGAFAVDMVIRATHFSPASYMCQPKARGVHLSVEVSAMIADKSIYGSGTVTKASGHMHAEHIVVFISGS